MNVKDDYTFKATGSRVIFPGFSAVYEDAKKEDVPQLPALKKNDVAHTVEVLQEQHLRNHLHVTPRRVSSKH